MINFEQACEGVIGNTLLSNEKLWYFYNTVNLFSGYINNNGEWWELGVWNGGSARMLVNIKQNHLYSIPALRLFDNYTGIVESTPGVDGFPIGQMATQEKIAKKTVGEFDWVKWHTGIIPTTFSGLEGCELSFVHLDVDTYKTHVECLNFVWSRLIRFGVILLDDYDDQYCKGVPKACNEFFHRKPNIVFSTGQAIYQKES